MAVSNRAPDIVVAGHICLDIIPALSAPLDLPPGGLFVAGPAALSTGGPVGNVGMALHRLGVPVRLIAKIGDDVFGGVLRGILAAGDPSLADGMVVVRGETTSYSVVINPPGVDRAFLHCPGANDTFEAADVPLERLASARIMHFGYPPLMPRVYEDGGDGLFRLFAAVHERGLVVSLDVCHPDPHSAGGRVDWGAFLARVLPAVDVFAPSLDEISLMLDGDGHPAVELRRLRSMAGRVLALGPPVVVLKLGDQGFYLRTRDGGGALARMCSRLGLEPRSWRGREVFAPCFRPSRVAGTTGAGDCTIAGLLAALLRGEDAVSASTDASAVGACCVEAPDATSGVRPWPETAARLAAGWPRLPPPPDVTPEDWRCDAHGTLFDPHPLETA